MREIFGIELIKFLCSHGYYVSSASIDDGLAHLFRIDDTFMLQLSIEIAPEVPLGHRALIYNLERAGFDLQAFKKWAGI